jgi:translocation protein SEC72
VQPNHSHSFQIWPAHRVARPAGNSTLPKLCLPAMSHSHTHAPGEVHDHSHGPPLQQQQQIIQQAPDPAIQALIEADFHPVDLTVSAPNESHASCLKHTLEKCTDCGLDFSALNRLSKLLISNPTLLCPPPPNMVTQKLSQVITNTKEEGNVRISTHSNAVILYIYLNPIFQVLFKMGKHREALGRYTMAASFAVQRPPWESNTIMREELSTVISNRSAAFFEAGDYIGALVDAETVIALRRNWSKGHFRKSKALVGLLEFEDAKDALRLGLQFEPTNSVSPIYLNLKCTTSTKAGTIRN